LAGDQKNRREKKGGLGSIRKSRSDLLRGEKYPEGDRGWKGRFSRGARVPKKRNPNRSAVQERRGRKGCSSKGRIKRDGIPALGARKLQETKEGEDNWEGQIDGLEVFQKRGERNKRLDDKSFKSVEGSHKRTTSTLRQKRSGSLVKKSQEGEDPFSEAHQGDLKGEKRRSMKTTRGKKPQSQRWGKERGMGSLVGHRG